VKRRYAAVLIAAALLTGACGTAPEKQATQPVAAEAVIQAEGGHNATDVMYLQMALAHHEPSAKLLALGREKATRDDVRAMATELASTDATEAATMADRLKAWGKPTTTDHDPAQHAGHGPGLHTLGDAEIAELAAVAPEDFDIAFVTVLVGHQHNAVELARMEAAQGLHPDVRAQARRTDERLRAQIQQMLRLIS
jgi:uncharacterized protein (DUF305 family)